MNARSAGTWASLAAAGLLVLALTAASRPAQADNPLALYAGAAVGQVQVEATAPYLGDFSEEHTGFKLIAGLRPIPLLAAELEYLDFGHPHQSQQVPVGFAFAGDVTMKGAGAFGMLFLPVSLVDIYAKAGLARLETHANGTVVCVTTCPPQPVPFFPPMSRTDTEWAAGAGVQLKLGSLGVRGEYERFNAADRHPYLLSLGAIWTF